MSARRRDDGRVPRAGTPARIGGLTRRASDVRRRIARLLDGHGARGADDLGHGARGADDLGHGAPGTDDLERRCARLERDGDLPGLVQLLYELVVLDPRDVRRDALRDAAGRLLATSPGWLPRVPGPPLANGAAAAAAACVLCLCDETVVGGSAAVPPIDGRRHRLLVAARMTGVAIAAMTPPEASSRGARGQPHPGESVADWSERDVEGIRYHRTHLGPEYARITPRDVALEHEAWLASWVARRNGANVIHAVLGARGPASGLVGVALRDHLGTPLVVEIGSPERLGAVPARARDRLLAAEAALLPCADVILVGSEAERSVVGERVANTAAFDADRILVVPDPDTEEGARLAGQALHEAYARASAHRASRISR